MHWWGRQGSGTNVFIWKGLGVNKGLGAGGVFLITLLCEVGSSSCSKESEKGW